MDQATDDTGKHRLLLKYTEQPGRDESIGYDFHSLVWETLDGSAWVQESVITRDEFQAGTDHQRWISEIDSLDPETGHAILKVAEGDNPMNARRIQISYSWREWDLRTNKEVRVIRAIANPFEPLNPTGGR